MTTDRNVAYRKGVPGLTRVLVLLGTAAVLLCGAGVPSRAERIKDLAAFEGVRENPLIGYGLVVGIDGKGDQGLATQQTVVNMLQRMGLVVNPNDLKTKNVAAVIVTATLPPFPRPGTRIDVTVSAIGDAKTLQGGTLLLTPLKGPDGKVYALGQGAVSVGGFVGGEGGTKVVKNHTTVGRVPRGGIVEKDLPFSLGKGDELRLFLHRQDFTNASRIAEKINGSLKSGCSQAVDSATVTLQVPAEYRSRLPELISLVEAIDVPVDMPALVTVNERTGTVVIGENVRISPVAIAQGNLTIEIKTGFQVSQPKPFAPGKAETVVVPKTEVTASEQKVSLMEVSGVTLGEIVKGLNSLGVTPRDLIAILQALRSSGALRAELEII
ncbi:MAG: flagellar basal body P-ring protein FlgI [Desulfobacteria bacterium]|nr:flagellar basal body P-ring protein FlgI [Deltaproteobacteria bacterium]